MEGRTYADLVPTLIFIRLERCTAALKRQETEET